jgi:hypothetical protein
MTYPKGHEHFADALEEFHANGGAMMFHQATNEGPSLWQVMDAGDMKSCYPDAIERGQSVRAITEHALNEGGLSQEEIAIEMQDWIEP